MNGAAEMARTTSHGGRSWWVNRRWLGLPWLPFLPLCVSLATRRGGPDPERRACALLADAHSCTAARLSGLCITNGAARICSKRFSHSHVEKNDGRTSSLPSLSTRERGSAKETRTSHLLQADGSHEIRSDTRGTGRRPSAFLVDSARHRCLSLHKTRGREFF